MFGLHYWQHCTTTLHVLLTSSWAPDPWGVVVVKAFYGLESTVVHLGALDDALDVQEEGLMETHLAGVGQLKDLLLGSCPQGLAHHRDLDQAHL